MTWIAPHLVIVALWVGQQANAVSISSGETVDYIQLKDPLDEMEPDQENGFGQNVSVRGVDYPKIKTDDDYDNDNNGLDLDDDDVDDVDDDENDDDDDDDELQQDEDDAETEKEDQDGEEEEEETAEERERRCAFDKNLPGAWGPGDAHKMFQRIVQQYQRDDQLRSKLQVLSRPRISNPLQPLATAHEPWVLQIDDFLTPYECQRLVQLGTELGYEESTTIGRKQENGTFQRNTIDSRTSKNAWCSGHCMEDPVYEAVVERVQNLTQISSRNYEQIQLLKYEVGEFYDTHNDYIRYGVQKSYGPRILTVYMYLNDVDGGGGTEFPELDTVVLPKQGRIVIWPSVYDAHPWARENRTVHGALPVIEGVKYGANIWIHQRDFQTPLAEHCT